METPYLCPTSVYRMPDVRRESGDTPSPAPERPLDDRTDPDPAPGIPEPAQTPYRGGK